MKLYQKFIWKHFEIEFRKKMLYNVIYIELKNISFKIANFQVRNSYT